MDYKEMAREMRAMRVGEKRVFSTTSIEDAGAHLRCTVASHLAASCGLSNGKVRHCSPEAAHAEDLLTAFVEAVEPVDIVDAPHAAGASYAVEQRIVRSFDTPAHADVRRMTTRHSLIVTRVS